MTKEGLYELIKERKVELEEQMKNSDPDLDRLKEIVESHNFYKAEDLVKLDLVELFPLILKIENQDMYDYYMKHFDGRWERLIKPNKKDAIYQLVSSRFDYIYDIGITYQLAANKYMKAHKGTKEELADDFFVDEDLECIFDGNESFLFAYEGLKKEKDLKRVASDIEWIGKLSMFRGGYVSTVDFLIVLQGYIDSYNNIMSSKESRSKEVLSEIETGKLDFSVPGVDVVSPDVIDGAVSSYVDTVAEDVLVKAKKTFRIKEIIPAFMKFYNSALQKRENFLKNSKRKIDKYNRFRDDFEDALSKNEVVNTAKLVDGLDEDIKIAVLGIIHEHNKEFYDEQTIKYQALQQNELLQFQLLLKEYGIEPGTYVVSDIMKYPFDLTRRFLDKLKEINIVESDLLVKILKFGNIDAINDSYKYIKRGIISTEFLKENIEFFDSDSDIYKNAMNNILSFLDNSFSLNYISSNQDVLLIENNLLVNNFNTIKQYGIYNDSSKEVNSSLLKDSNLAELFDVIIELGYEDRLESNLDIAAYGRDRWRRIELLKQLGVVVLDSDLGDVLRSDDFFVSDNELDNYIFRAFDGVVSEKNSSNDINLDLTILQQYDATSRSYDINGVVISKNKVMRNLSKLNKESISQQEKVFISLLCGRSITKDEYESVSTVFEVDSSKVFSKINCN